MADLFGSKAANRGLVHFADREKNILSVAFDLWCRKLDDVTVDDFKVGMDGLESRAEQAYREGSEMWPPSYAEFRALCFPLTTRDTLAHKPFERAIGIEDQTAKAKRYELGQKQAASVLELLGDKPASTYVGSSIDEARVRLEKANQLVRERS